MVAEDDDYSEGPSVPSSGGQRDIMAMFKAKEVALEAKEQQSRLEVCHSLPEIVSDPCGGR